MSTAFKLVIWSGIVPFTVFGADCNSALKITNRVDRNQRHFFARNASAKPVVAYTIAISEVKGKPPTRVFSGVFSGQDSLGVGKTLEIGVTAADTQFLPPVVDFVRLADGWTCGDLATVQGQQAARRFQE